METQNWPIRSKIVALVSVPIVALLALWIFATSLTVGPASSLLATRTLLDEIGRPGDALIVQLQQERRLSVLQLADRDASRALADQRVRTDRAIVEFRRRTSSSDLRDTTGDLLDARIDQLLTAVDALPSGRVFIDRRSVDASGALGLYSGVVDAAFRVFAALNTLPDDTLSREARSLTELGRAREVLAQADALLAGVFSAGRFGPGEHAQIVQIIGTHRFLYAEVIADLPDADRAEYQRLTEGDAFVRLRRMEDDLIGRGGPGSALPVAGRAWQSSYEQVQRELRRFELAGAEALTERSRPVALGILVRLGLAGLLGFAAVLVSGVIAVRIGRSLVRRLTGLRAEALTMANDRLPDVVERLRKGEEVDVAREAPPLDYGQDEIGQVGQAFSEVQQTAIASAIDEAALRRGLRDVFLNIARRSQTLLHRQLALLDRMERRAAQPSELADLFRLDHMATRMRRHAEDLVVLAGAAAGRGWRNPVSVVDVIRGAVSEVEDYARVDLVNVPPAAIAGRAVGDVIHLLAELIENATSFSPPHTRVQVSGHEVSAGYAIEIEDRGLGMTAEAIEQANRRLVDPPEFDPANSARLGLFVVALLGARHGVQVELRASPYGGVTAVVLVPSDLVDPDTGTSILPGDGSEAATDGTTDPTPLGRDGTGSTSEADPQTTSVPTAPTATPTSLTPAASTPAASTPGSGSGSGSGLGPRRKAGAALEALVAASAKAGAGAVRPNPADPAAVRPGAADPVALRPGATDTRVETSGASGAAAAATGSGTEGATATQPSARTVTRPASSGVGQPAGGGVGQPAPGGARTGDGGTVPGGMTDDTVVIPVVTAGGPVHPAAAPAGEDGLPRRIRQTNLVPQLRDRPGAVPARAGRDRTAADRTAGGTAVDRVGPLADEPLDEPPPRTPEQVRAVMSALQAGTARGRRDADPPPSGETSDNSARVTDPGSTNSEGDG
ncbi:nitrate- and nitrite sensing domain-containing protein [Plantactinospora alkalitolerans]|uniref:nitrate- and nitrite sensing domain-containing protein n=1 Tax=Plantactinospora alkalitolerans TaxID=2789879 RepID=UPI001E55ADF5|nr:nitrate- and nitrite sensing domain-containing protein [Plantactinospora alkalitolerans]